MKKTALFVIVAIVAAAGCGLKPDTIDQAKFEKLFRAAKAIEIAGPSNPLLAAQAADLAIECSVAETLAANQAEKTMVDRFRAAVHPLEMSALCVRAGDVGIEGKYAEAVDRWHDGVDSILVAGEWYKAGKITSLGSVYVVTPEGPK